ncbi:MAG: desulfoferrodoxin family protein [Bacillota bacterium]|jgi:superoxide reductase
MCGDQKFFLCEHCGNLIGLIEDSGVEIYCCGEPMTYLEPNTVDASREKHVPVASIEDNTISVKIGSDPHPMIEAHYISWIYLQTQNGGQRKCLKIAAEPEARFTVIDDTPVAAYAYCNLHGLWKTVVFTGANNK